MYCITVPYRKKSKDRLVISKHIVYQSLMIVLNIADEKLKY